MEITIMKLRGDSDLNARDYYNLLQKHEYTEDIGTGFKDLNIEENGSISGLVIKRTPIFVSVYDTTTETIIQREEFVINEIDFRLDTIYKLIEIYAPTKDVKKLLTAFLQTVDAKVKLDQITLKPSRILEAFNDDADSCEITKLNIKDFSSEKGVVGNYDIKSVESDLSWRLVDEYKNDVVRATISVNEENIEAVVQIFQNGKFKITTKPRNNSHLILYIIKNLISKTYDK